LRVIVYLHLVPKFKMNENTCLLLHFVTSSKNNVLLPRIFKW
jgi:hypothetical protein